MIPLNSQRPNFNETWHCEEQDLNTYILLFKSLKIRYPFPLKLGKFFLLNICGDDVDNHC